MDPTYANYEGQLAFAVPGTKIVRLPLLDRTTWTYWPTADPDRSIADFRRVFDAHQPRMVVFGAPDNPTSQILPQSLVEAMHDRAADAGAWLAVDFAYKCQYLAEPPAYFAGRPRIARTSSASTRIRSGGADSGGVSAGSRQLRPSSKPSSACSSAVCSARTHSRRWR